jgi:hypothetical protein
MSTIKVNVIEPYSGSTVSIVGLSATASNALWSGISGIPAGLVSGSYSSSMSTRISAQEDFSSSLDATFATEAELDAATGSLVKNVTPSLTTATISILNGDGSSASKTIYSSSFAIKANSVRRALSQGSGIETFSYDGGSVQSVQLNTSSAHFTTGAKSAAGSASFSTRVTNLEDFSSSLDSVYATDAQLNSATSSLSSSLATDISTNADNISTNTSDISTLNSKTLVSSSISGDSQGQIKVNGVNVNVSSLQTTSNPTFANLTGSNILVSNNLVVNGTASFAILQSVTGSAKIIGDAYIILNNNTPAERYAGLVVQDSGSAGVTASLEFDGQTNDWFYEYSDDGGVTTDHGVVIFGPEYNTKGSPTYLTEGTIPKSTGSHHIVDSNITDNGSLITLGSNTSITGTVVASGTSLVSGSEQIVLQSADKTGFTGATSITTLGTITTGNVTAILPTGTVSGSAQIDLGSATGTAANATSASYATTASFALSAAGGLTAQTASVNTTMVKNTAYVVTGTASPITMSLPSSPTIGELIKFANMDDRATLLARNGNNIMGLAEDMTLNVEQVSFDLVYVGPTAGWTIYGSRALS